MAKSRHFTFEKKEKLCHVKVIKSLIKSGKSITNQPFRIVWDYCVLPDQVQAQVAFIVPKKNFKLAVMRNRIKRQMREIYRQNKYKIIEPLINNKKQTALLLIFGGKKQLEWNEMESKIILVLHRFEETINAHNQ